METLANVQINDRRITQGCGSHRIQHPSDDLTKFVEDVRAGGGLFLLGGHYDYPGVPSPGSVATATVLTSLQDGLGAKQSLYRIFLNDIGATLTCASGSQCGIESAPPLLEEVTSSCSEWLSDELAEIERMLVLDPQDWRSCASRIAHRFATMAASELGSHPILRRLSRGPSRSEVTPVAWLKDLELFCYANAKPQFRPLSLTWLARKVLPPVLFEKSMNNAASRLLHRLGKQPQHTGLHICEKETGSLEYSVSGPDGSPIQLRQEVAIEGRLRASNKCAGILAQLFNYACRQVRNSFEVGNRISIFYLIPCFDRARLYHGMHAFCELFSDVATSFGVEEVVLVSAFFMTPDRSAMKCDVFTKRGSGRASRRTVRVPCALSGKRDME